MRKQTKKVLSMVLSAAMVLTMGTGFTSKTTKAADALDLTFTMAFNGGFGWGSDPVEVTTGAGLSVNVKETGDYTIQMKATADANILGQGYVGIDTGMAWADYTSKYASSYDIVGKTIKVGDKEYDWSSAKIADNGNATMPVNNEWNEGLSPLKGQSIEVKKDDIVSFTFNVGTHIATPAEEARDEYLAEAAAKYTEGTMDKFNVKASFVGGSAWDYCYWGTAASGAAVTKDGSYTIDLGTTEKDFSGVTMAILDTNLYSATKLNAGFGLTVDSLTVGGKSYKPATVKAEVEDKDEGNMVYTAQNERYCGDGKINVKYPVDNKEYEVGGVNNYRVNITNSYNAAVKSLVTGKQDYFNSACTGDDVNGTDGKKHITNAYHGQTIEGKAGDKVSMTFTVKGMGTATVTPPATTAPTKKTASLKAASSTAYIAAGKSKTVKYTAKAAASSSLATVSVKSSNTKVVKATINQTKKTVKLSVPKKATLAKSATVTLSSSGKTAKIKVYVQNKAKKVTAKKKSASVKAKKTVKLTFTVKSSNKKNVADTLKATSSKKSVAKVTKVAQKKNKVTVTVKAVKKGKAKITLKVGSKKATTKVTVKK